VIDMRTLKVGQKVRLRHEYHSWAVSTVVETTGTYVRIEVPREETGVRTYWIDFDYEGGEICAWEWVDGWDPRSFRDLQLELCDQGGTNGQHEQPNR